MTEENNKNCKNLPIKRKNEYIIQFFLRNENNGKKRKITINNNISNNENNDMKELLKKVIKILFYSIKENQMIYYLLKDNLIFQNYLKSY